jgi:hypothetical protein
MSLDEIDKIPEITIDDLISKSIYISLIRLRDKQSTISDELFPLLVDEALYCSMSSCIALIDLDPNRFTPEMVDKLVNQISQGCWDSYRTMRDTKVELNEIQINRLADSIIESLTYSCGSLRNFSDENLTPYSFELFAKETAVNYNLSKKMDDLPRDRKMAYKIVTEEKYKNPKIAFKEIINLSDNVYRFCKNTLFKSVTSDLILLRDKRAMGSLSENRREELHDYVKKHGQNVGNLTLVSDTIGNLSLDYSGRLTITNQKTSERPKSSEIPYLMGGVFQ